MQTKSSRRSRTDRIDRIDVNILAVLFKNARSSKVQMSTEVGISASRCYERMQRLERSGIVRGYHADIDIVRLTSALMFVVPITLVNSSTVRVKQFEKALLKIPEITSSQSVLGNIDYLITIVASSIEDYQAVLAELRAQGGGEFDFVTYPVSKTTKAPAQCDLRTIVSRMSQRDSGPAADRLLHTTDKSDDNS